MARVFTKEELQNVLLSGNDRKNNALLVLVDGTLELAEFSSLNIRRPTWAVRNEAWCAGNGFVGIDGCIELYIDKLYFDLLAAWYEHLKYERMDVFVDGYNPFNGTVQQLIEQIEQL